MPRTFIHETDEKAFTDYIQNEGTLQDHILQFSTEEGRRKTVNGAVFNDFHKYLFDNDFWPYNMQNDTLFMLLYDCGGRDKYIDAGLDDIFRRLSDNPPKGRVAQNEFLDTVLNNLQRFAPFDEGVRKLCDFVEFAIETNTREIQKEMPNYSHPVITDEERLQRDIYRNDLYIEYNSVKDKLTQNGWDFTNKDDEEFIRTLFELREKSPETGKIIFDTFMEKALSAKIYNVVDKDKLYAFVTDHMHETHADEYEITLDLRSFISYVRGVNEPEVKTVNVMTEQTTDLFDIINTIGKTANARGEIHNLMSYEESDSLFYDSGFVNEADFARADKVFDEIFGGLISEQKKTSLKASEMSGLDLITNTFKIMKPGYKKPMDLKAEVEKRLKASGRFLDENEEGVLADELNARKATNEKNMTTLAKLYILHEMQNPETGIFYEAYFGDRQYTMSDPVSQYLDINHPRIVKAKDLEEHKLQHDTNILEYFGKDNGMLYEENYNAYVLGALHDKQIIKQKNPYQKINGISYTEARDILIQRGWNFTTNPSDENYLIMLFNSHDPMGKTHITVENSLKKLLETNIHGFHDRNNLLREIYNDEELKAEQEDLTLVAFRDYILEDIKLSAPSEIRDKVLSEEYTFVSDINKRINGLTAIDMKNIMNGNGWEIDKRIDVLINRLYNACDENYASAGAIAECLSMLTNAPSDMNHGQMNELYLNMRNKLSPFIHNDEIVENIDRYLFDLTTELNAMMGVDVSSILSPEEEAARYKQKNESGRRIATGEDNAITNVNGIADNFREGMKEEDFEYDNEPFAPDSGAPVTIENNGVVNMYEHQKISDLYHEFKDYAEAYNDYKYIKSKMLEELTASGDKLLKTEKQHGKDLGAEGTGTPEYRAMASKLKDSISILMDPDSKPEDIRNALTELENTSLNYKTQRKSIFGKRGDGKTRFDEASKLSDGRLSAMILNLDKNLKNIESAGVPLRSTLKAENVTDKTIAFACGSALGIDKEKNIPKQTKSILENRYNEVNAISRAQAEVKKQLNKIPVTDEASRVVLGKYSEELLKPNATIEDIRRIGKKAENKSIKKEIEALKKSRVFARVIKNNPKNYLTIWKNITKAADELKETNSEFLSVMTNTGSMSDYVLNKKDTVNRQNDPDHYKESYKRLSQIITLQIVSENDEFARGVILESLDKKSSTRSVINELQNVVEKFLMENKTLEGRGFSKNKLENGLRNESLKKDIVTSIVKMNTKKPEKKTETNIHKTNDSKTVSSNVKK